MHLRGLELWLFSTMQGRGALGRVLLEGEGLAQSVLIVARILSWPLSKLLPLLPGSKRVSSTEQSKPCFSLSSEWSTGGDDRQRTACQARTPTPQQPSVRM